jgi:hypothetical protein
LSASEFPTAAQYLLKIEDEAAGGSFLFGYFFLATQEKVTRQSRESDHVKSRLNLPNPPLTKGGACLFLIGI